MKIYISKATKSAYWLDNGVLVFASLQKDGTFDTNDAYAVDDDMFGDEHVFPPETENFLLFSDVYAQARKVLNA